jgi:hypothetical protein
MAQFYSIGFRHFNGLARQTRIAMFDIDPPDAIFHSRTGF